MRRDGGADAYQQAAKTEQKHASNRTKESLGAFAGERAPAWWLWHSGMVATRALGAGDKSAGEDPRGSPSFIAFREDCTGHETDREWTRSYL